MRLLVTGGAGYVGSHTCASLLGAGHEVVVVDDFSNSTPDALKAVMEATGKKLEWREADIRDRALIKAIAADGPYDAVLHFAALKSAPESIEQPGRYWDVNVGGMAILLDAVAAAGVDKFVFSSSAIVYGAQRNVPIPETMPPAPLNPYAWTKLVGEQMLRDLVRSRPTFKACILRYFNPIGAHPSGRFGEDPRQPATNLFPAMLAASRNCTTVDVYGTDYETPDGSAIRDFIHVMDVAEGHVSALDFLTAPSTPQRQETWTFNLGTGRGCSVIELIETMEAVGGRSIRGRAEPRRQGDIAVSVADIARSTAVLGWQARRSLRDACIDSLKWLEQTYPASS
jgi:UDP-glucose 4-epimerase